MEVAGDPHDFMLAYNQLDKNSAVYRKIIETIDNLKNDNLVGKRIKQKQIPLYYIRKHDVNAVYKVNLPNYFRLIYGILAIHGEKKAILMELFDHGKYNKRFGY